MIHSHFWQGYVVGGLCAAIGGPTFGHWIVTRFERKFPWRVRIERKDVHA